ncbi:DUF1194 domain-containing protein [Limibaculum sp. FT325]|uniref:DUF1194 domain-containing protein n=1 Tax=Thermohalobaculum sediminis TaxID=2939436 RepID=UPI0020BF597A|nr:DUF1194 domain-containing protein [Limibaculum sediminis]MCL5776765.1 DUF1194 domain-containing protein [Limibaculum sediminis]
MTARAAAGLALAGVVWLAAPAAGACGLELILAVDVSGSVDADEFAIQMGGLADAFASPSVAAAIAGVEGGVLATLTQWSGVSRQRQMVGWHRVTDAASAQAFAAAVRASPRAWRNFSTAIGEAIAHAHAIGAEAPEPCGRRVIDISGDGASNEGQRPRDVSRAVAAAGYTINALVIRGADPDPLEEYMTQVIAGPGAFVEVAEGFDAYPQAILRKLLREIEQPLAVSAAPGGAGAARSP